MVSDHIIPYFFLIIYFVNIYVLFSAMGTNSLF
jgi:hypothetical protein